MASSGVTAAVAKRDACMLKNAPRLQKDITKRQDAMKKAVLAVAMGSGTPSEKKAILKKLMENHINGNEQYTAAMVSKCMGDVAATLREMSKLAQAVCKKDKSNNLCKSRTAVLAAQKKADSRKLTARDVQELAKKMADL